MRRAGSALAREKGTPTEAGACPTCGMSWNNFKQAGLLGCPHDYEIFSAKLLPLLKRAQEGACEHAGKIPSKRKTIEGDRHLAMTWLARGDLRMLDAENYEQAASLRDKLKDLEQN